MTRQYAGRLAVRDSPVYCKSGVDVSDGFDSRVRRVGPDRMAAHSTETQCGSTQVFKLIRNQSAFPVCCVSGVEVLGGFDPHSGRGWQPTATVTMAEIDLGVSFCVEHVHMLLTAEDEQGRGEVLADFAKETDEARQLMEDIQLAVDIVESDGLTESDIQEGLRGNDMPHEVAEALFGEGYEYTYHNDADSDSDGNDFTDINIE